MTFIYPKKISGWLSYQEGKFLYQLAQLNSHLGVIVELGCYHGRSTICLVQGSQQVSGGKIYSVDNFSWDERVDTLPNFYNRFKNNIQTWKMTDKVVVLQGDSVKIGKKWQRPIRLLFIDASHFYPSVLKDYLTWSKWVVPGGIIAFHDSEWPGVNRLVGELILAGKLTNFKAIKGKGSTGLSYGEQPLPDEKTSWWQKWQTWLGFKLFFLASFWPRFKMNVNQLSIVNPCDWRFRLFGRLAQIKRSLTQKI